MTFHRLHRRLSDRNYGCRLRPRYLIFSPFLIYFCQNAFGSGPLPGPRRGCLQHPQNPSWDTLSHTLAKGPTELRAPGPRDPTIRHWPCDRSVFELYRCKCLHVWYSQRIGHTFRIFNGGNRFINNNGLIRVGSWVN